MIRCAARRAGAGPAAGALPLLLLLLLAAAAPRPGGALELVQLSDSNFEHETQAATGQTTGRWCVLFVEQAAAGSEGAEAAWDALAADVEEMEVERQAVFAKVDLSSNPEVARRFAIATPPAAILFRDRMMYRLPAPLPEDEEAAQHLAMDFLAGGWEEVDGEEVPPESAGRGTPAAKKAAAAAAAPAGAAAAAGGGAGALQEAAAAAARRLAAALGETDAVLRATGVAAAVVGAVVIALASYLGINMNFNASGEGAAAQRAAPRPAAEQQQAPEQAREREEEQEAADAAPKPGARRSTRTRA